MDKYEYRIKAEQIRKLAEEGDYESAVKIVSTIDWNRVKSIPMLSLVGKIYEKCERLEESRDMYLIAYDRHPYGRTIIFALAELSIRLGEYIDAVEYYKEFVRVAPRDSGRYILQYKLYEAQEVGIQERIAVLEEFMRHEPVEKWAFELAYLYHRAGMKEKCVEKCDEIVLWFGEGKYVEKAMELKMLYQPLTPEQKEKYDNRNEVEIERSIEAVEKVARMAEMKEKRQKEEDDIHIKTMNIGIYDTVNLQEELKKSMRAILNATEQENIDSAMDSVKKIVKDNQLEKIFDENGETTSIALKLEKEKAERAEAISELLSMDTRMVSEAVTSQDTADEAVEEPVETEVHTQNVEELEELLVEQPEETELEERPEEAEPEGLPEEQSEEAELEELSEEQPEDVEPEELPEEQPEEAELEELSEEQPEDVEPEELPEEQPEEAEPEELSEEQPEEAEPEELPAEDKVALKDRLPVVPEEYFVTSDLPSIEEALKKTKPVVETQEDLEKTKEFVLTHKDLGIEDAPTKRIPVEEINRYMNIAVAVPEENDIIEKQITGEMCVGEILDEWDKVEQIKEKELEEAKKKALEETGSILERLEGVIPSLPEDMRKLMQEGGIEKDSTDTVNAIGMEELEKRIEEGAKEKKERNKVELDKTSDPLDELDDYGQEAEEDEDAAAELQSRLEAALPEGIESLAQNDREEQQIEISADNGYLSEELREIFTYFAEMEDVNKQLVRAIEEIELAPAVGNVAIMGAEETGKTKLAVDIVKAVQKSHKFKGKKIAKITGGSLNNKKIEDIMKNAAGGVLMIERAGKLSETTMIALAEAFAQESKNMIVIIEDTKDSVDVLFRKCPDFAAMFTARIELPEYTNDDLVAFAKSYAKEQGYAVDDIAILALYSVLDDMQVDNHIPTLTEVKDVMDGAIEKARRKNIRNMIDSIFSKRYDEEHYIYIRERDFE